MYDQTQHRQCIRFQSPREGLNENPDRFGRCAVGARFCQRRAGAAGRQAVLRRRHRPRRPGRRARAVLRAEQSVQASREGRVPLPHPRSGRQGARRQGDQEPRRRIAGRHRRCKRAFGPHPPRGEAATDHFWTAAWIIPDEHPTGTFAYKATATDMQGQTQTWEPFKVTRRSSRWSTARSRSSRRRPSSNSNDKVHAMMLGVGIRRTIALACALVASRSRSRDRAGGAARGGASVPR